MMFVIVDNNKNDLDLPVSAERLGGVIKQLAV